MTVSEAIIQWLKQFAPEKMRQIDTDRMHGDVDFALVKEPTINEKNTYQEQRFIRSTIRCLQGFPA